MSSGLGEALGQSIAQGIAILGCLCLVIGLAAGILVTKACSAGWRVQFPITRSK